MNNIIEILKYAIPVLTFGIILELDYIDNNIDNNRNMRHSIEIIIFWIEYIEIG